MPPDAPETLSRPQSSQTQHCLLLLQFQRFTKTYASAEISESEKIQEVIRYINANFTQNLTLSDLADHFFTSKSHLLRQFSQDKLNRKVNAFVDVNGFD